MNIDFTIDKGSIIPVYYQIAEYLKKCMDSGELKSKDKLPTEQEFCEAFQVSRMTVRQALDPLVREGKLEKIKGKGTYVRVPKIKRPLKSLSSFTVDTTSSGKVPRSEVLFFDKVAANEKIAEALEIIEGSPVVKLERLRLEDDLPHAYECSYLNYEKAKDILGCNLKNSSLYATLDEVCGVKLTHARETIEAGTPSKEIAKALEIPYKTPTFHRERITRDEKGKAIEYVLSEYRMDKFVFVVELENN